jgi:hypothetical protein
MTKFRFPRGSIMIWTLLMGISLAVVFFFFSVRLNASVASQRETMVYLNARLLMDSYADYVETLSLGDLEDMKAAGSIDFNGFTGTLTNDAEEITGTVDAFADSPVYKFTDNISIEWNLCSNNFKADLVLVNGTETLSPHVDNPCTPDGYDDLITADVAEATPFSFKSNGIPFEYRIKSTTPDQSVPGNEWQLNLEMPLGFRKKITVSRTFTP